MALEDILRPKSEEEIKEIISNIGIPIDEIIQKCSLELQNLKETLKEKTKRINQGNLDVRNFAEGHEDSEELLNIKFLLRKTN